MKTHDLEYAFRGYWSPDTPDGKCRVRILQNDGAPPILVITELLSNRSTSVTNAMEWLAAELVGKYLPHRFEALGEPPAIVVEHYPPRPGMRRGLRDAATYDLVTFASWRPRRVRVSGGFERITLGEPDWRHLPPAEVRALLGDEADDLPAETVAASAQRPCPTCAGVGKVRSNEPCLHPEEDREGINCHRCHDSGYVLTVCPTCHGSGVTEPRSSPTA
jgi:hypothetical protein